MRVRRPSRSEAARLLVRCHLGPETPVLLAVLLGAAGWALAATMFMVAPGGSRLSAGRLIRQRGAVAAQRPA